MINVERVLLLSVLVIVAILTLVALGHKVERVKVGDVVEVEFSHPEDSEIDLNPLENHEVVIIPPTKIGIGDGLGSVTRSVEVAPIDTVTQSVRLPRIIYESIRNDTNGDGKINLEDNRALIMTDANGSQFIRLTNGSSNARDADWSPDGRLIIFASDADGDYDIYTMSAEGGPWEPIFDDDLYADRGPSWSPDGQWIAFYSDRDGDSEIYLMRPDGSELRQLTVNDVEDEYPTWYPDSNWIAYQSGPVCPTKDCRIYQLSLNGQAPELFRDRLGFWPSYSPDGRFLGASIITEDDKAKIITWDLESGTERTLVEPSSSSPNWSPDSRQIAYVYWITGGPQVWIMNNDGSEPRQLTSGGYSTRPVYSP